jgi:Tfp pilus assembly protein PilF
LANAAPIDPMRCTILFNLLSKMSERIKQLFQFINEDPTDPFNHYALALEYCKTDEKRAVRIFEEVVKNHKQYIAVYYQLATLYARIGEIQKAVQTFNEGITIARSQGDVKTLRELSAGLQELLDEHQ